MICNKWKSQFNEVTYSFIIIYLTIHHENKSFWASIMWKPLVFHWVKERSRLGLLLLEELYTSFENTIKMLSPYKFHTYVNDYLIICASKMCHMKSVVYPQNKEAMLFHYCPHSLIHLTNIYLTPTICQEHIQMPRIKQKQDRQGHCHHKT